jgi:hypothetical protein
MKKSFRRSLAVLAVTAAASGSLVVGLAGTASAAGNPPWEPVGGPDVGSLSFYNSTGQQITGGNLTDSPIAAYVQGSTALHSGDTTATLFGILPVNGVPVGQWTGDGLGGSTYPNHAAPGSLGTSALPLVSNPSDLTLAEAVSDFPNNDTSTTDGYSGLYVLRLFTSSSTSGQSTNYDAVDIQLNNVTTSGGNVTGGTWSVVYPALTPISTTTTLTTTVGGSPVTSIVGGTSVTLNATVSAGAGTPSGTVQFEVGGLAVGSPQTLSGGTASLPTSSLPVGSPDALSAVYTPATPSGFVLGYGTSTGNALLNVTPAPSAATATALSANPTSSAADSLVTLTADVTNATSHAALNAGDGQVVFYDDGTDTTGDVSASSTVLGTVTLVAGGVATLSYSSFSVGDHNLVAAFQPANSAVYNGSLSSANSVGPVLYTASAPTTTPDPQTVTVGIPAGSLVISTPYGPANPFSLGEAALDSNGSEFSASGAFGTPLTDAADPTTGLATAGGVLITDTRAGDTGWTASAVVTNFAGPNGTINGQNLEFTGVTPSYLGGNALQSPDVTTQDVTSPAESTVPYASGASGNNGLAGIPHAFAFAGAAATSHGGTTSQTDGSVWINGELKLVAPTSTPAGTYTATLTFTIA